LDAVIFIGVFCFSLFAGTFGALMGLGGGLIIVPILIVIFQVEKSVAVAASIVAVIATSCAGASVYCDKRQVNIRLGTVLETMTVVGAIIGALITVFILPPAGLLVIFTCVLLYAAVYMYLRPETIIPLGKARGRFCGRYHDEKAGKDVEYEVRNIKGGLAASFVAGNLSGMLGVGGGLVQVPVMNGWMKVPIKAAIATSNFMIGVTAVASAYIYYTNDWFNPVLTAVVATGVFIGARGGSLVSGRIDAGRLRGAFIAVILLMAALMIVRLMGLY
jgi:hypothetical protein